MTKEGTKGLSPDAGKHKKSVSRHHWKSSLFNPHTCVLNFTANGCCWFLLVAPVLTASSLSQQDATYPLGPWAGPLVVLCSPLLT